MVLQKEKKIEETHEIFSVANFTIFFLFSLKTNILKCEEIKLSLSQLLQLCIEHRIR